MKNDQSSQAQRPTVTGTMSPGLPMTNVVVVASDRRAWQMPPIGWKSSLLRLGWSLPAKMAASGNDLRPSSKSSAALLRNC
jgi:hypothetical protein